MKITIAGAGEVGKHLSKVLAFDAHDVTVIDVEEGELSKLSNQLDILTIKGSALSISILLEAKVSDCDLFIAVTHFPEMNVASSVLAKKLGAKKTIARVRDPQLLEEKNIKLFNEIGIDSIIYPQALAAREITKFVQETATREFFDFAEGLLSLYVLKIEEDSPVIGKYLHEIVALQEDLENFRIIMIKRDFSTMIPRGDDVCLPHDILYIISNKKGSKSMLETFGRKKFAVNNIMILGASRTGRATAKNLQNLFDVKLIEVNEARAKIIANELTNVLVINGDGRSTDLLVEEGIRNTDVFIATTENSETNILSCYLAKSVGVKRTIAEVENFDYIALARDMGIDTVINKKTIAANSIHKYTLGEKTAITSSRYLTETEAQVLEIFIQPGMKITEQQLKFLDFPRGAVIGGVVRGKDAFIPKGNTQIKNSDKVLVFAMPNALNEVKKFFETDK